MLRNCDLMIITGYWFRGVFRTYSNISRIRRPAVFCRKDVLGNFANFIRIHLCQSLWRQMVQTLSVQKETLAQMFSCEFYKSVKNTFFTEHLWVTASLFIIIYILSQYVRFPFLINNLISLINKISPRSQRQCLPK